MELYLNEVWEKNENRITAALDLFNSGDSNYNHSHLNLMKNSWIANKTKLAGELGAAIVDVDWNFTTTSLEDTQKHTILFGNFNDKIREKLTKLKKQSSWPYNFRIRFLERIVDCPEFSKIVYDLGIENRWDMSDSKLEGDIERLLQALYGAMRNTWVSGVIAKKHIDPNCKSPKLTKQLLALKHNPEQGEMEYIQWLVNLLSEIKGEYGSVNTSKNIETATTKFKENKLKLSIHPLDFLTQSYNDNGWQSCTCPEGDYNYSAISGMLDWTTMVAYVESGKSQITLGENETWNNKKWRMLVHFDVDKGLVVFNKHYPYYNYMAEKSIVNFFKSKGYVVVGEGELKIAIGLMADGNFYLDNGNKIGMMRQDILEECIREKAERFSDSWYYKTSIAVGNCIPCIKCGGFHSCQSWYCDYCEPYSCESCYKDIFGEEYYRNNGVCDCCAR